MPNDVTSLVSAVFLFVFCLLNTGNNLRDQDAVHLAAGIQVSKVPLIRQLFE